MATIDGDALEYPGFGRNFIYSAKLGILKSVFAAIEKRFGPEMIDIDLSIGLSEKLISIGDGMLSQCYWNLVDPVKRRFLTFKQSHFKRIGNA